MTKIKNPKRKPFLFEHLEFDIVSHFVLRISDLFFLTLGSFEEINPKPFFQGDGGLLPVRPFPVPSAQSFQLAQHVEGSHLLHLHLKEMLDGMLNLNFIGIRVDLEHILTARLFLLGAFFSNQRPSDDRL
jgi:hypothetical protein